MAMDSTSTQGQNSNPTASPMRNLTMGLLALSMVMAGCAPSKDQIKKVLTDNPDILHEVIKKDPAGFMRTVSEAAQQARAADEQDQAKKEEQRVEEEFKNPKKPNVADTRGFGGTKGAPITIVEYSDFQCPFCRRGNNEMKKVLEAYPGKVRLVFKNLPLDGKHPLARPASRYYEALVLQNNEMAQKFKDEVFNNQGRLNEEGEKFLKEAARKLGANMARLDKDVKSEAIDKLIDEDVAEANQFGFNGTPGYLVNGVSVFGAYPFETFKGIIDRHLGAAK